MVKRLFIFAVNTDDPGEFYSKFDNTYVVSTRSRAPLSTITRIMMVSMDPCIIEFSSILEPATNQNTTLIVRYPFHGRISDVVSENFGTGR